MYLIWYTSLKYHVHKIYYLKLSYLKWIFYQTKYDIYLILSHKSNIIQGFNKHLRWLRDPIDGHIFRYQTNSYNTDNDRF